VVKGGRTVNSDERLVQQSYSIEIAPLDLAVIVI
jgi:hypothetical protein